MLFPFLNFEADIQNYVYKHPVFAKHETFTPRFFWLKKGFELVKEDPYIFQRQDAVVKLGVGKNMVRAIRHWCSAFHIIQECGRGKYKVTPFGEKLLGTNGWDPYLEDPASLWLLHWMLFRPPYIPTVWYYVFHELRIQDFSPKELCHTLEEFIKEHNLRVSATTLRKDIACLLRMYSIIDGRDPFPEEGIISPFCQLQLIEPLDKNTYAFVFGAKENLAPAVVVAASLQFICSTIFDIQDLLSSKTVPLSTLLYKCGSPGQAFKIGKIDLCEAIASCSKELTQIHLTDTAGLLQIGISIKNKAELLELTDLVLEMYYRNQRNAYGDTF